MVLLVYPGFLKYGTHYYKMRKKDSMKKLLKNELLRYMIVGGCSTAIDATIFLCLTTFLKLSLYRAFLISFSCGVLVNFTLCNWYVFTHRTVPLWRAVLRHYSASLGGFAMQFSLFFCLISFIAFPYPVIARIAVAGCTFILNFLIIKRFVFGHK